MISPPALLRLAEWYEDAGGEISKEVCHGGFAVSSFVFCFRSACQRPFGPHVASDSRPGLEELRPM
jgi:hypothetical protein